MHKMLCLDIDGTLLNSKQKIPEGNKKAIRKLHKKGIPVVLVTARPAIGVMGLIKELGIEGDPLIAFGGALIIKGGEIIQRHIISFDDSLKICETVQRFGCEHITVFNSDIWAVRDMDEVTKFEMKLLGIRPTFVGNIEKVLMNTFNGGVDKFLVAGEPKDLINLKKKLDAIECKIETTFSKPHYLEIHPAGISKAKAVSYLGSSLGINHKEVIACGDNFNDLSMIEWAGVGVAMGNAPDEVKYKADFVTLSNDECGVEYVIDHYFPFESDIDADRKEIGQCLIYQ